MVNKKNETSGFQGGLYLEIGLKNDWPGSNLAYFLMR